MALDRRLAAVFESYNIRDPNSCFEEPELRQLGELGVQNQLRRKPGVRLDRDDLAAQGLLRLLRQLRTILLQDSTIFQPMFPGHPLWPNPVFMREDYRQFAEAVLLANMQTEAPYEMRVQQTSCALYGRMWGRALIASTPPYRRGCRTSKTDWKTWSAARLASLYEQSHLQRRWRQQQHHQSVIVIPPLWMQSLFQLAAVAAAVRREEIILMGTGSRTWAQRQRTWLTYLHINFPVRSPPSRICGGGGRPAWEGARPCRAWMPRTG